MAPNPNMMTLIIGTIFIQICLQIPVQRVSLQLFMISLPQKNFPIGSKIRKEKAEMLAERVYKLIIHTATTGANFFILKNSTFLKRNLLGDHDEVFLFKDFPCQKLPNYLDDLYVIKLSYHFYEQFYTLLF